VSTPIHLHPTAPLAERVLLPGDPGRALLLAQSLLAEPKMFNHNRGLWGYSGDALLDGRPLTIQSTGMGGPSAAIVIAELADLGARTLLRVGTCGALVAGLALGDLLIATEALAQDGTSRALGAGERVAPSERLLAALADAAGDTGAQRGAVVSTDLFYDGPGREEERWAAGGAAAVEMESATLFALARRREVAAGALLIVSDVLVGGRQRIGIEELHAAEHRLGELAVRALAV
jgi:purine-nucleoside phosphorylase